MYKKNQGEDLHKFHQHKRDLRITNHVVFKKLSNFSHYA